MFVPYFDYPYHTIINKLEKSISEKVGFKGKEGLSKCKTVCQMKQRAPALVSFHRWLQQNGKKSTFSIEARFIRIEAVLNISAGKPAEDEVPLQPEIQICRMNCRLRG